MELTTTLLSLWVWISLIFLLVHDILLFLKFVFFVNSVIVKKITLPLSLVKIILYPKHDTKDFKN